MFVNYDIIQDNLKKLEEAKISFGGELPSESTLRKHDLKQYIDFENWCKKTTAAGRKIIYDTLDFKTVKEIMLAICGKNPFSLQKIKPLGVRRFNRLIIDSNEYNLIYSSKYGSLALDSASIMMNWAIQQGLDVGIYAYFPISFYTQPLPNITSWHTKLFNRSKEIEQAILDQLMSAQTHLLHIDIDSILMRVRKVANTQLNEKLQGITLWKCVFEAPGLTVGKTYEATNNKLTSSSLGTRDQLQVMNDDGVRLIYSSRNFMPADTYRESMLEALFGQD